MKITIYGWSTRAAADERLDLYRSGSRSPRAGYPGWSGV